MLDREIATCWHVVAGRESEAAPEKMFFIEELIISITWSGKEDALAKC